jgi:F0F1-type ATP synthase assembly protein I
VQKYRPVLKGYGLAMQISGMLMLCTFCSLFSGIWLDRQLGTAPCFMFLLLVIGFAIGMYNIYRVAQEET